MFSCNKEIMMDDKSTRQKFMLIDIKIFDNQYTCTVIGCYIVHNL